MTRTQQPKNPVKRAFPGLVGRGMPQDESVTGTSPTHAPQKAVEARPTQKTRVPVEKMFCLVHAKPRPCPSCFFDEQRDIKFIERRDSMAAVNAIIVKRWKEIAKLSGIQPDQKCAHGVYLYRHYCEVCAWERIDPGYNPDIYRVEISKALKHARRILSNGEAFVTRPSVKSKTLSPDITHEGQKDFEDLVRLVDMEIWQATKSYGDKMTPALAYTVAKNQAGRFLADRIEEQTILVVDGEGNPVLDEFGYPERIPRFKSMDDRPGNEDGDGTGTTKAEVAVINSPAQGTDDWQAHIPALRQLASTWHGDQRRVAEAMLKPGFNVRSVPGVEKSKVSRIHPVVLRAFKALITRDLKVSPNR